MQQFQNYKYLFIKYLPINKHTICTSDITLIEFFIIHISKYFFIEIDF